MVQILGQFFFDHFLLIKIETFIYFVLATFVKITFEIYTIFILSK